MARALLAGKIGEEGRLAVCRQESLRGVESARLGGPLVLAAGDLGAQVVYDVGNEGARQPGLDVTLLAVVEHGLGQLHAGGGVGHVVGDDLAVVEVRPERRRRAHDHLVRGMDDVACG